MLMLCVIPLCQEVAGTMTTKRVKVSRVAFMARINRKLAYKGKQVRASRSAGAKRRLGAFFVLDVRRNIIESASVDPVALARELGVLKAWEDAEGF